MSETKEEMHPSDAWEKVIAKAEAAKDLEPLTQTLPSNLARPYNSRMKASERGAVIAEVAERWAEALADLSESEK